MFTVIIEIIIIFHEYLYDMTYSGILVIKNITCFYTIKA